MGAVRRFTAHDIPQVSELHRRVFRTASAPAESLRQSYKSYFTHIFLSNPWGSADSANPGSLVYEDDAGNIGGFLGIVSRRMTFKGSPIHAAISSQFIVDPSQRSHLAGVRLMKAFLSGPQDLSIADEANQASRTMWEALGGSVALLYSLYWTRFLRPARFLASRFKRSNLLSPLIWATRPACGLADWLVTNTRISPLRRWPSRLPTGLLDEAKLLHCLNASSEQHTLRPDYDLASLSWLLDTLANRQTEGPLQRVFVGDEREQIGWYMYHSKPEGLAEVLQIGARDGYIGDVLQHLFQHAWQCGVAALSGRVDPFFMPVFWDKRCVLHHRGYWMLVHSKNPELVNAIQRGDAFLTRLEGEWSLRFQPTATKP